jgi:glycosyltransferase involved in cell wall biosynthesis
VTACHAWTPCTACDIAPARMPGILLDLTPLATGSVFRGIGRYVRGLAEGVAELGPEALQHVHGLIADPSVSELSVVEDVGAYARAPMVMPVGPSLPRRNRLTRFGAKRISQASGRLLHFTDPSGFPFTGAEGHCLTCHDLIPLIFHREYEAPIPGMGYVKHAIERRRYARARRVLAVSHATRRDLCERLGILPERVEVVWHGVDHRLFHPRANAGELEQVHALLGSTRPYVLYVGAGDPRKDLETLVTAFAHSRLAKEATLAIVGRLGKWRPSSLPKLSKELGVENQVKLTGYVDEAIVPALYRNAAVHVFPSRYEGFGFPIVEALAAGCPTITSPGSSLDEVAGDAAEIVPCGQAEALTASLETLFFDTAQRQSLRERGLARAATFTWKACAEQTLAFWQRAQSA